MSLRTRWSRASWIVTAWLGAACVIDFDRHFAGAAVSCDEGGDGVCVSRAPDGFAGPYWVIDGADAACPNGTDPIDAGTACGGCNCNGSATCGPVTLDLFQDGCAESPSESLAPATACAPVNVSGGLSFARASTSTVTSSCKPGAPQKLDLTLCGPTETDGCSANETCIPPSIERVCYARSGLADCPATLPERYLLADGSNPTCGACACDAPPCAGAVLLFGGDACDGTSTSTATDGMTCTAYGGVGSVRWDPTITTCTPSGGEPDVTTGVRTICCAS
jgi:hypothetical protein